MSEETVAAQIEALEQAGSLYIIEDGHDSQKKLWRQLFESLNPDDLFSALEREGCKDTQIEISGDIMTIYLCKDPIKKPQNYLKFNLVPPEVELEAASITEREAHSAKRVMRAMADVFMHQDYDTMTLSAQQVGSYAWAKYGFLPDDEEWQSLKEDIKKRVIDDGQAIIFERQEYPLTPAEQKIIQSVLKPSSNPEALWKLTDLLNRHLDDDYGHPLTVGKALLFDQTWEGELCLEPDSEGFERFINYTSPGNLVAQSADRGAHGK